MTYNKIIKVYGKLLCHEWSKHFSIFAIISANTTKIKHLITQYRPIKNKCILETFFSFSISSRTKKL